MFVRSRIGKKWQLPTSAHNGAPHVTDLRIDLETSSALNALSDLKRSQIPFATALALTRTAQYAQREIKAGLPERFTIRSPFIERGVRVQSATKVSQEAAVYWRGPTGSRFAESLARHETGGLKRPANRYLAIPRGVKRGAGGKIPKSQRPASLLKRKRVYSQEVAGGKAIFRRGAKGAAPQLLYFLTPRTAKIAPEFHFRDTARDASRKVFKKEFGRAFAKAIATRRGR